MKKIYSFAAIALLLGLTGCLSTVYPIFTEKDVVFDPKIIGKWRHESKSEGGFVEIAKATSADMSDYPALKKMQGKIYLIKYLNNEGVYDTYLGFLVKLGNKFYMDYFPAETPEIKKYNGFYRSHFIKMHTCFLIRFLKDNNTFELKQFSEDFLKNLIDNKKIHIRHEVNEAGSFIVTAPTEELQQYILKYSDVPEAYYQDNTSTYTRLLNQ
jgi:hypothetical protein